MAQQTNHDYHRSAIEKQQEQEPYQSTNMPETKFHVGMTCEGCSGAVTRLLKKMEGVSDVACNIEAKTAVVTHDASVTAQQMFEKLQKWSAASGKSVAMA